MSHLLATIESKFVPILLAKSECKIEDPDKCKRHRELYAGNSANVGIPSTYFLKNKCWVKISKRCRQSAGKIPHLFWFLNQNKCGKPSETTCQTPSQDFLKKSCEGWRYSPNCIAICRAKQKWLRRQQDFRFNPSADGLDLSFNFAVATKLTPVVHALNYLLWLFGVSTLWEAKLTR